MDQSNLMDTIVSLCKRRGFVYPASEIYGGISGLYDFGPYGVEMKNNLKRLWWNYMVSQRKNVVGIDGAVITHPDVWKASGHLENFNDPLVECSSCKSRFRVDDPELEDSKGKCPKCDAKLSQPRAFNLMMATEIGVVEGEKSLAYLRGEACQSIYLDYNNVLKTTRMKIPFGIAQMGKAFRNEVTCKNFLFRQREFEQWDLQYFVAPDQMEASYEYWKQERMRWFKVLFSDDKKLRFRQHRQDELAHYAKVAFDIEFNSPLGWKEMEGIHWRSDWDLSRHSQFSGVNFQYTDDQGRSFIPQIVETSGGDARPFLFLLLDAYTEEVVPGSKDSSDTRVVLKLNPNIAPVKAAILPLSKDEKLIKVADEIYRQLSGLFAVEYDQTGSIGKRYRRQDEIGTPYCLTVDFDTLKDKKVTVRDRDTTKQERAKISDLESIIGKKLKDSFTVLPK
ncbi:MAG: glycine--tRNA ligase [Patescibacteria group bacterium]